MKKLILTTLLSVFALMVFAAGEADINNDSVWNEFKSTLKSLGREDLMKIAQNAYDRK